MKFKQGVQKSIKVMNILAPGIVLVLCSLLPIVGLFSGGAAQSAALKLLLIFVLPIALIMALCCAASCEWFCVYEDRIEVMWLLGKRNTVYFKDVEYVEKTSVSLGGKLWRVDYYIFNDGRKNNDMLDQNSWLNKKKFNVRIYRTPELEALIGELGIEIRAADGDGKAKRKPTARSLFKKRVTDTKVNEDPAEARQDGGVPYEDTEE